MIYQWIALCVASALICTLLRPQRPELAMGVALATGVAVIVAMASQFREQLPWLQSLWQAFEGADPDIRSAVLRVAGVAVISDFAAQLCRDAGESALAGRVMLIARLAILALCVPLVIGLAESFSQFAL